MIEAGDADFASLARPFLADPEIVAKSRSGRGPVNVCIACNQCIDNSIFDRRVSCVVNPRAGFELDVSSPGAPDGAPPGSDGRGRRRWSGGPRGRAIAGDGRLRDRAVRSGRATRRPVPDGVADPRQGGLRQDDRVLRARTGGAGGVGLAWSAAGRRGGVGRLRRGRGRHRRAAPTARPARRRAATRSQLRLAAPRRGRQRR